MKHIGRNCFARRVFKPTKRTKQITRTKRRTRSCALRGGSSPGLHSPLRNTASVTNNNTLPSTASIARPQYERWEPGMIPKNKTTVCNNQTILTKQMYYYRLDHIRRIADLVSMKHRPQMASQELASLNNIVKGMDKRWHDAWLEPKYGCITTQTTKIPAWASKVVLDRTYEQAYF
jgi:hypothetical protein